MKILAQCDKCNSRFSVEDKFFGEKAKCSKCGEEFIIQAAGKAIESQRRTQAGPDGAPSPAKASGEADVYSLAPAESPRCPSCQKTLAPRAVLCVNCGYDLRLQARVQVQEGIEEPKPGGTANAPQRRSDVYPAESVGEKKGGIFRAQKLAQAGLALTIFSLCAISVWGLLALYWMIVGYWHEQEAFRRLDALLGGKTVNAKKLAAELPYLFAYQQQLSNRAPDFAAPRNALLLAAIPRLPKDADPTPLLQFPPDSPFYKPIFKFLQENTDHSWRMQKSCDSSEAARRYGADLLMASLPFISWSEADKDSLRQRTGAAEKERRFRKFAAQSQTAVEKKLPGRYNLRFDAAYTAGTRSLYRPSRYYTEASAESPCPVLGASCKNSTWTISFFGRVWTGPVEDISRIDITCPLWEYRDLFPEFPLMIPLREATAHLRFKDNAFAVEVEGYQQLLQNLDNQHPVNQYDINALSGFNRLQTALLKADAQEPLPPLPWIPATARGKVDRFAEKLQAELAPALQSLAEKIPQAKEVRPQVTVSDIDDRVTKIELLSTLMDKKTAEQITKESDKQLLDPAGSPYIAAIAFKESINVLPGCSLTISWKCFYVYHGGKWTFLCVSRIPSREDVEAMTGQLANANDDVLTRVITAKYAQAVNFFADYSESFENVSASHPVSSLLQNIE